MLKEIKKQVKQDQKDEKEFMQNINNDLSDKDRIIVNRLQTAESYINYTLLEINKEKTCKNIRNILQETLNVLNTAKDIIKTEYWYI